MSAKDAAEKEQCVYCSNSVHGTGDIKGSVHCIGGLLFTPGINQELLRKNCCKRAYLRGAFMAGGSVNNPEGSSYHLEIASMYEEHCQALVDLANEFHLNARCIERKKDSSYTLRKAKNY